jgi:hypothetical protein
MMDARPLATKFQMEMHFVTVWTTKPALSLCLSTRSSRLVMIEAPNVVDSQSHFLGRLWPTRRVSQIPRFQAIVGAKAS